MSAGYRKSEYVNYQNDSTQSFSASNYNYNSLSDRYQANAASFWTPPYVRGPCDEHRIFNLHLAQVLVSCAAFVFWLLFVLGPIRGTDFPTYKVSYNGKLTYFFAWYVPGAYFPLLIGLKTIIAIVRIIQYPKYANHANAQYARLSIYQARVAKHFHLGLTLFEGIMSIGILFVNVVGTTAFFNHGLKEVSWVVCIYILNLFELTSAFIQWRVSKRASKRHNDLILNSQIGIRLGEIGYYDYT